MTQAASRQRTTASTVVVPLTAAQLTQYKGYAAGMQRANVTATKSFVGAGSTPTQSQLAQVVSTYGAAVNLYDFQLRFIQWPASMQAAITVDHAQLESLVQLSEDVPYSQPEEHEQLPLRIAQPWRVDTSGGQSGPSRPRVARFVLVPLKGWLGGS